MTTAPCSRPPRLLVLACSATKRPDPGRIPALARYDGPLWRTLRATDPDGRMAQVAVLSARYGFRNATTPITDYDARPTPELAARMIAGGVTTRWPRPSAPRQPDTFGMHAGAEIAGLTRYGDAPIGDVALVGGRLYLDVMRALVAGFVGMGCVRPESRVTVAIGLMRRDLRRWLCNATPARGGRP
jgi:hypothetical protein